MSITAAMAALSAGGTVTFADGVYTLPGTSLNMGASGATLIAASGAKPVITSSDSKPPTIVFANGTTIDGLWFGGTHDAAADRPINMGDDVTVQNCTFWSYNQCLNVTNLRTKVKNCHFVNCGNGRLQHSIYYSTVATNTTDGARFLGNIALGGEGYLLHMFHSPAYAQVINNFFGHGQWDMVVDGNHHTVQRNILWTYKGLGQEDFGQYIADNPVDLTYDHNVINAYTIVILDDPTNVNANTFVNVNGNNTFGGSQTLWTSGDIATHLGVSSSALDSAIAALESSFTADIATIRGDGTIATNFALLAGALATR